MGTYPAEEFGDVGVLADVAVVCDYLLEVLDVLDFGLLVVAVVLGVHLLYAILYL